ncbi:MAG: iron ABC transporter substrate-binding protein [Rhodospirillaceae bacterium]|nr:iron ABC transporter substrate-binding protein [Rhodospirillaceae bacterium]
MLRHASNGSWRLLPAVALAFTLAGFAADAGAQTKTITDSAGRKIAVPAEVKHVYAAGNPATILIYTLAPEKLIGWTRKMAARAEPFMPKQYFDLPEIGRLTDRGNTANIEVVLGTKPDLIFDYGTINQAFTEIADRMQEQTKIPYMLVDGSFDKIPEAYRLLGQALGVPERAEKLATYAERVVAEVKAIQAKVPVDKRPKVYYGRGPNGLDTGLQGSINVELLEKVGARNVAEAAGKGGLNTVSIEQVLTWNPDIILTIERDFFGRMPTDPRWSAIKAIKDKRFYLAPEFPFPWFDMPPSVNRLMGVRWLTYLLYPDQQTVDLAASAREFYELFYHIKLTDAQVNELLATAARKS